jgi:transcriptional regulator with XRE-family HTH domain
MLDKEQQTLFYQKLGENIKEARRRQSMNQEELGEKLGLSRVSVVNIETGKQRLPIHVLGDITGILRVKMNELVPDVSSQQLNPADEHINLDVFNKIIRETKELSNSPEKVINYLKHLNKA